MQYAIEARDLRKSFSVPERRIETVRERIATGSLNPKVELMPALNSVSFGIRPGEFFGIIGRNGSGKSTLLRVLAGVYQPDSGMVVARGRIAPIIELGVGFAPDLSAAENVLLNGVMMGLSEDQARGRLFRIVEFAGLSKFMGLKLKNYSSGMRVRLAFAIMVHVDADVMLIDEVLAVGDGAFRAQSEAALRELNAAGRTIVLVSHSMPVIEKVCDRAMVLEGGLVDTIGEPREVTARYRALMGQPTSVARPEPVGKPRTPDASNGKPPRTRGAVPR